jgi:hypothetical protein
MNIFSFLKKKGTKETVQEKVTEIKETIKDEQKPEPVLKKEEPKQYELKKPICIINKSFLMNAGFSGESPSAVFPC